MNYATYVQDGRTQFKYCVLSPVISTRDILKEYITPFSINPDEVVILDLHKTGKKTPVKEMKEYSIELLEAFKDMNTEYVIVTDADYYKILSGHKKVDGNLGYVTKSPLGAFKVIYAPNYKQIFYNPVTVRGKIAQSMNALLADEQGRYTAPGGSIIRHAEYLYDEQAIVEGLQRLWHHPRGVTCDIEGFSLKHYDAGLGTISFAWNQGEGLAIPVDFLPHSKRIREILRDFFIHYPNKIIFHHASYDVTVLIYQLFMDHLEDTAGLLFGLNVFMEKIEDTKLIAYLATNTCAGNAIGLKDLAQEFAGNYAVDEIADITRIPLSDLLQYNLVDSLSTWYVFDKYYPIMVEEDQEEIYLNLFRPALADIIQMQLTGMPINPEKVQEAKRIMEKDRDDALNIINNNYYVQQLVYTMKEEWVIKRNSELKKKRVTLSDAPDIKFNPNSDLQLQRLLFTDLGLPVLKKTDSGLPSTKGEVIASLKHKTTDPKIHDLLDAIIAFKDVIIILTTFITAFEKAVQGPSGQWLLFGFFNLGGTVSGRLSSNGPNLQNIPSKEDSKYSKIIKQCFMAIAGWLFVGLDFSSLEDMISALTTKDPNKLKVYIDGFDGHCLRAYFYFEEYMPDIDPNSVASINSIKKKYKALRGDSKTPTFLLTYGGTWIGIVDKMGWSAEKAKLTETRYHEMYVVSDQWVQAKLDQAAQDGYVTCAFGLRVRTPLLKQVIRGTRVTPFEAEAEGRTAGNALGQSWGLLNTRAVMAFMKKVRSSDYRLWIRPCAQIHDANYYLIKDDPELLIWMNEHLVREVKWQNHPDIWHDQVKLGGELSVFYPSWADELSLPNELDNELLSSLCRSHINDLEEKNRKTNE